MSVKQHISRWIFASVAKHFNDRKETNNLFIEGMIERLNKVPNHVELKIDGPYFIELSRNYFNLTVVVNAYIQAQRSEKDAYSYLKICGIAQKAFTRCIPVYAYGNGPEDTSAFIGSLQLVSSTGNKIVENQAGQIKPSENLTQSQIEAHYEMHLEMDNG